MAKVSVFGVLTNIQILLLTFLRGKKVGADQFGNIYYTGKARRGTRHERRWVIYKNGPEASTIPAEWHGWIHHQTDRIPSNDSPYRKSWQKPHLPNMTGTDDAYLPPSLKTGKREAATGDYTPWQPPK